MNIYSSYTSSRRCTNNSCGSSAPSAYNYAMSCIVAHVRPWASGSDYMLHVLLTAFSLPSSRAMLRLPTTQSSGPRFTSYRSRC